MGVASVWSCEGRWVWPVGEGQRVWPVSEGQRLWPVSVEL